jgi:hypothetical protein
MTPGRQGVEQAASQLVELVTQWDAAIAALWALCQPFESVAFGREEPGAAEVLLQCPSLLPCVAFDLATSTQALLLLQRQDPELVAASWP